MRRTEQLQGLRLMKFEDVYGRFARRSSGSRAYPRSLGLAPPTVFSFKRIRPVG